MSLCPFRDISSPVGLMRTLKHPQSQKKAYNFHINQLIEFFKGILKPYSDFIFKPPLYIKEVIGLVLPFPTL